MSGGGPSVPTLLFNDECAVCRSIAAWVGASSRRSARPTLDVRPIGDDPEALRRSYPSLDIWDAYATIHLVMPDGTMMTGGSAVAETLRALPNCRWFAWIFRVSLAGVRPFTLALDLGYVVLADARPLLGCESCGIPSPPVAFVAALVKRLRGTTRRAPAPLSPHFSHAVAPPPRAS